MEAVAHNPSFAKKAGVPQSVGKEFSNADKGKTFKRGGEMATKMDPKMMAMMAKKKSPMAPRSAMAPAAPAGGMGMMKKGGMAKMATGGLAGGHKSADGIASKGKTKGKEIAMKRGGKC
ncbi:MAG: hypothetical protein EBV38_06200 [Burkholderiaceae bacterium]|nr:hypothetical protein [Burkholderiaceae bacterium]